MNTRLLFIPAVLALACGAARAAGPAADDDWNGMMLFAAGFAPQYEGASDYEPATLVVGNFNNGHRYFAFEGTTFRANLLDSDGYEAGPLLSFDTGRSDDMDNEAVAALGEIDTATELGVFGAWSRPLARHSRLRLLGQYLQDVNGVYDGWRGSLGVGYSSDLPSGWSIGVDATLAVVSDAYAAKFFSVSQSGSDASGLRPYAAGGGAENVGLIANASYPINRQLAFFGLAGYQRVVGEAADSPILVDEGDPNQFILGAGIGYFM